MAETGAPDPQLLNAPTSSRRLGYRDRPMPYFLSVQGNSEALKFLTLLGGEAVAWACASRAQQAERTRRIGVLITSEEADTRPKVWLSRIAQGLAE